MGLIRLLPPLPLRTWVKISPPLERPSILEHLQALCVTRHRSLDVLQPENLRLDLRPAHQAFPPQLLQLASVQAGPAAELN